MDKILTGAIEGTFHSIMNVSLLDTEKGNLIIWDVLVVIWYILITWSALRVLKIIAVKTIKSRRNDGDENELNRFYSFFQIIRYILYAVSLSFLLGHFGIDLSAIFLGSTALLVGIGLGMQNLFNDFVSGILILFDRTLLVNDILEVDGIVGKVVNVGIRTTKIKTRDDKVMLIPNHFFMSDKLVNWTQNKLETRFSLSVGVAYGSDTSLVKKILVEVGGEHSKVLKKPLPEVLFQDFADSSLNFDLIFYIDDVFNEKKIKSDLRFMIDKKFRKNNIAIPFPQRDIHVIPR